MLADVKDFLCTFKTCYNCSKLSHFTQSCTEFKKVSLRDHIQEIFNLDKDKDEKETKKKVEETLKMKN